MIPPLPACQESVQLFPGDWLLIFSDGIPEAANANGEEFGDSRLLEALGGLRAKGPAAVCEDIVNEVRDYLSDHRQPDDITLIAAQVS
jgi:sigma-B regulation protein RsbU (phosphoserine phosphatase)